MAKKYKINVLTSNGLQQIIAERVFEPLYPSHWFMLHRPVGGERKWAITETQTGLMVTGGHKTKAEAINRLLIAFGNACLEMGKVWRLHTGKDADVVYEWTPDKERE